MSATRGGAVAPPFTVAISEDVLDDLHERLRRTRKHDQDFGPWENPDPFVTAIRATLRRVRGARRGVTA